MNKCRCKYVLKCRRTEINAKLNIEIKQTEINSC